MLSPLKLRNFGPLHFSFCIAANRLSQPLISVHARSLTALWIGTTVAMSAASGEWFLRFMASKNIFSEGYIQFEACDRGDGEGNDVGVGVVVSGESSARGMELVTRSEARGRFFVSRGGGGCAVDGEEGDLDGGGGRRASCAASTHAERAEGSTGQVEGGESAGGEWMWLEEVFPMA